MMMLPLRQGGYTFLLLLISCAFAGTALGQGHPAPGTFAADSFRMAVSSFGVGDEEHLSVTNDGHDNSYVITWYKGKSNYGGLTDTSTNGQVALVKYNPSGHVEWRRRICSNKFTALTGPGSTTSFSPVTVAVDSAGNALVYTAINDSDSIGNQWISLPDTLTAAVLTRFDKDGTHLWTRVVATSQKNPLYSNRIAIPQKKAIVLLSTGEIVVACRGVGPLHIMNGPYLSGKLPALLKLSPQGEFVGCLALQGNEASITGISCKGNNLYFAGEYFPPILFETEAGMLEGDTASHQVRHRGTFVCQVDQGSFKVKRHSEYNYPEGILNQPTSIAFLDIESRYDSGVYVIKQINITIPGSGPLGFTSTLNQSVEGYFGAHSDLRSYWYTATGWYSQCTTCPSLPYSYQRTYFSLKSLKVMKDNSALVITYSDPPLRSNSLNRIDTSGPSITKLDPQGHLAGNFSIYKKRLDPRYVAIDDLAPLSDPKGFVVVGGFRDVVTFSPIVLTAPQNTGPPNTINTANAFFVRYGSPAPADSSPCYNPIVPASVSRCGPGIVRVSSRAERSYPCEWFLASSGMNARLAYGDEASLTVLHSDTVMARMECSSTSHGSFVKFPVTITPDFYQALLNVDSARVRDRVTIRGVNLDRISTVLVSGIYANFQYVSPTEIGVVIPWQARTGFIELRQDDNGDSCSALLPLKIVSIINAVKLDAKPGNGFYFYPNPAKQCITLSALPYGVSRLSISDAMGKEVFSNTILFPTKFTEVKLPAMAPGLYTLRIGSIAACLCIE